VCGLDLSASAYGLMADCCGYGNGHLGFIKCREYLGIAERLSVSQERLYRIEVINELTLKILKYAK
jgi:hypothetical protein